MNTVRAKVPRHIRRLMAGTNSDNYTRREFAASAERNALYGELRGRVPGAVRYSDVNEAGVAVYVVAWPIGSGQGIGTAAQRSTPARDRITPISNLEKISVSNPENDFQHSAFTKIVKSDIQTFKLTSESLS